jgi:hypothetical protein
VLLVAERAALLADRDDEFTTLVTIGYTGMRWGETIGLERYLLLSALINVEWQLREVSGRFHRLPPKDDSYRSTNVEPLTPVDIPPPSPRCWPPGRQARTAAVHLRRRADVSATAGRDRCHPPPPPQDLSLTQRVPCCGATKPADERSRQARTMLLVLLWTSLPAFPLIASARCGHPLCCSMGSLISCPRAPSGLTR